MKKKKTYKPFKRTRVLDLEGKRIVVIDKFTDSKDMSTIQTFLDSGLYSQMESGGTQQETPHASVEMNPKIIYKTDLLEKLSAQVMSHFACKIDRVNRLYM